MEIIVQLTSGRQSACSLDDEEASLALLQSIDPERILLQPTLRICCKTETLIFNTEFIETIRFVTKNKPRWPLPDNIIRARELNPDSFFFFKKETQKHYGQNPISPEPTSFESLAVTLSLVSGNQIHIEYGFLSKPPSEQLATLNGLFSRQPYPISCDNSYLLINPKNIAQITLVPAVLESKDTALIMMEDQLTTS